PRYPPFAVDALEISDQRHAEIPAWRQTEPPHLLRVEARTLLLHVLVKAALLRQPVQLLVERMPLRPRQLRVRDPQFLLSSLLLFSTHSHAQILRISAVDHTIFFLKEPRLSPRTARRRIAPKAIARFKERIREQTRRTRSISLPQMVKEIATYLRGWLGYFGDCQTPSVLHDLETWVRRRLRSVVWKQWKRGRTRFRELRKRGVSKDLAAQTAGSPHGPWRLANSPALAIALPNAYFAELGLLPLVVRS